MRPPAKSGRSMAYRVLISAPAETSLDESVRYIAGRLHATLAASRLLDKYERALHGIADHPLAHGVVEEYRAATDLDVRRSLVGSYELDYYVDEAEMTVYVVAFLHGLQDRTERLLDSLN